ncbi:MAG: prolyl oligopeptidase family serine peptidase [candidate division Zixibacteria bacterium]|nr:prolyl oligopeptidase family serine peptidase [candidate division Zixibacteria bacterium]
MSNPSNLPIGRLLTVVSILLLVMALSGVAQEPEQKYMMPPQSIANVIDAPFTPRSSFSPNSDWMLLLKYPGLPTIETVSQPELRLAGLRINPRTNGPSRGWYYNEIIIKDMSDGSERSLSGLPENAHLTNVDWSPNGRLIAFSQTTSDGIELWVADIEVGTASRLGDFYLNDAYGSPFEWLSDNMTIVARTIPSDRGEALNEPMVPVGPVIQENLGRKAPARTYQDLLTNAYDEAVFDYYATSQVVKVTLEEEITSLGNPGVIGDVVPSPDAKYLLVETLHRPYSYTVPFYRFPVRTEVWNLNGEVIYEVADLPLADNIPVPFGSTRTGRRSIGWRADVDASLYWTEALDGGDAGVEAEERDRVSMLKAPFDGEPIELITLSIRFEDVSWCNKNLAIVSGWWWKTRQIQAWHVYPGSSKKEPRLLVDRSWEDRYGDPGTPLMRRTDRGTYVLLTPDKGKTLFMRGDGASPEGDRPFLDEFDLKSLEHKRLFHSQEPYYERPVRLIDPKKRLLLTRRESVTEPPNYFMRDLKKDGLRQITSFPHPTPQLKDVQKEMIRYERTDGVQLTATLYLPDGYKVEDGPLPMLMWAYPQEYKSADAAGQVTDSPYRFIRMGWYSPLLFLAHGYAVLDDPTMPIVGEGDEEPNDTYIDQLVASAQAAVDEVVRRGVGDPERLAIGGHSYGAFMAANLLAHSDLFKLGIARSGAYNRSLTPFGFQSEERTFWESPEVYFAMSPFMHADKVNEPILLIHGEADNNSGTYPLQSKRFYAALKGQGATARLVMLPHESHGYRARESVMHVLYEMADWLDTYVKNASTGE